MSRRAGGERGSALLLMPTAVLVIVILGSIAVDSALVFTAQRELADAAAAAANDAVTAGLSDEAFYACGSLELDAGRAREVAARALAARSADIVDAVETVSIGRDTVGAPTVTVSVVGSVSTMFAPAVPGGRDVRPVRATATASAARADNSGPAEACTSGT